MVFKVHIFSHFCDSNSSLLIPMRNHEHDNTEGSQKWFLIGVFTVRFNSDFGQNRTITEYPGFSIIKTFGFGFIMVRFFDLGISVYYRILRYDSIIFLGYKKI